MIKAFLSHTSLDKDLVGLVHSKLMPSNAWYDAANIENGESIPEKINEGLRNATHYVLFWSERASKSSWVRAELNAAFVRMLANKCKFMIFTLDDTELPELLQPYKFDKLRHILRGKRKAILTNIEARFIGYSKHSEDTALELLETVSQKYRDKQWYAVKIQLLEKIISKNEKAGRKILAEQLLKEQEYIKNEFQVKYGESAISDIDLLPDM